ncbi:hypothetical protein HRG_013158 [Hirsutella rhossiliensis]
MYKDLDSYALSQHYMSFLAGGALQWFMNELSIEQKDRLMKSSVERFCKMLIKRFQRPAAEVSKELHGIPYTVSMWNAGEVSLPQWIQPIHHCKGSSTSESALLFLAMNSSSSEVSLALSSFLAGRRKLSQHLSAFASFLEWVKGDEIIASLISDDFS